MIAFAAAVATTLWPASPFQQGLIRAAHAAETRPSLTPEWTHWLGWARDNRFIAWRQGGARSQNRPGDPIWLAEVGADGQLRPPRRLSGQPKKLLLDHDIHGRVWVWRDQVTAMDVVMRSRGGTLLAVAVRDGPPTLAVLRKWQGEYQLVASRRVPGPVTALEAQAYESPDGSMVAVLARTEAGRSVLSSMFILPLKGPPPHQTPTPMPQPVSATEVPATAAPLSQPSTPTRRR